MKRLTSVICMLLAMVLLLGSLPVALANTMLPEDTLMDNPRYANSFLLWVESETKRAYTPADFPMVEDLYYVNIAKMTPTENGYQYLLFMAIDTWDLDKAKVQAGQYGGVMENYLASDYANATSRAFLNHSSVKMKVGETIDLSVIEYYLTRHRYGLEGVVFTVNPEMMDEAALVESGYQDLGIWFIYGDQEEPVLTPMYEVVGVIRESANSQKNQVSPLHSYYAVPEYGTKLITLANTLANLSGVEKVELVYGPLMYAAVMPSATYSCSPKGIVDVENVGLWDCTLTALQPGEAVVTAKVWGGGYGQATVTCKVTVVEDNPPVVETPTDIPTDTPTDVTPTDIPYGDVNGDTKIDAKDALMVLKYAVQKMELTQAQQKAAEVDGKDGINAKDALEILKYSVKKITKFPIEEIVITPTDVTPTNQ